MTKRRADKLIQDWLDRNKKTAFVGAPLTKTLDEKLDKMAQKLNVSRSEVVRRLIEQAPIPSIRKPRST